MPHQCKQITCRWWGRLIEDHRLIAITKNAMFQVPGYRARQDDALQVAALADEIFHLLAMRDAHHVLFDDGAIVQHRGHVMAGGADQFGPAVKCRGVGTGADEGGQERVVNVDDARGILLDERRRQNLHVAGQHHQVDAGSRQQSQLRLFGGATVRGIDGDVVELDAMETRQRLAIRMIGDDQGNRAVELSGLKAVEEIGQTVQVAGYENGHPRGLRHQAEAPAHLESGGQGLEFFAKPKQVERRQFPLHTHEKELGFGVLMLIGVGDVGAELIEQVGDAGHQALAVGTIDEENGGIPHTSHKVTPVRVLSLERMDRIGRYKIVRELGRGAMGVVYHAIDPNIGRPVAIKTISFGGTRKPEEIDRQRERLFREARSAGMLSHPGIVTIYDVEQQGDLAYIAMEYVDGPTLAQVLSEADPLNAERMFSILAQTADFGIAKITAAENLTMTGSIVGTPHYMSPEQVQGQPVDGRSDQFSLAVIAYEMLTGEKPYTGEHLTTVVYKIVAEEPVPPHHLNPSLSTGIENVLRKA